jgi:hypothetical protein
MDRPLGVRYLAAVVVHDRAADDLGGAGRALIDQDDQGEVLVLAVGEGPELPVVGRVAPLHGDDERASRQEQVRDLDRRAQGPARVQAQVEDEVLHAQVLELGERVLELARRLLAEVPDVDIPDAPVEEERVRDAQERDLLAGEGQVERLVGAVADEGDGDIGPLLAPELLHGVVARQRPGRFAVDLGDDVAGLDAHAVGRPALDRGDDDDVIAQLLDLHAHPEVLAHVVLAHPGEAGRVEEVGVGVERFQSPLDGGHGQVFLLERFVVVPLEEDGDGPGLGRRGGPKVLVAGRDRKEDQDGQDQGQEAFFHRLHGFLILSSAGPGVKPFRPRPAPGGPLSRRRRETPRRIPWRSRYPGIYLKFGYPGGPCYNSATSEPCSAVSDRRN